MLIWTLWPSRDGASRTSTLVKVPSAAKVAWIWTLPYRLATDAPFTTVGVAGGAVVAGAVVAGAVVGALVAATGAVVSGAAAVVAGAATGCEAPTNPAGAVTVADALLSVAAKAYASPLVVMKLRASAALREWRAGWRRFFLAGPAPGGGGGGGEEDDEETIGGEAAGRAVGGVVRELRAVTRWRRAASSTSSCLRMSGSLSMCPLSQATL